MKQRDRIERHLLDFGHITTLEAIYEYGCTRLSEYIRQLRKIYNIKSVWHKGTNRYGEKTHFVEYVLVKGGEE